MKRIALFVVVVMFGACAPVDPEACSTDDRILGQHRGCICDDGHSGHRFCELHADTTMTWTDCDCSRSRSAAAQR